MNAHAVQFLTGADPVLGKLIRRVGPITLQPRRLSPFQSLSQAVIYQQLSGKAAATILSRFRALFPGRGFPTPKQVRGMDVDRLRSAGLSRPKCAYLRSIAEHAMQGSVLALEECDRLTDADLVARLTQIKGVGQWTVEMLLIFNLGRPDVLPVHDLGVRRGYQLAYGKRQLPAPRHLARVGRRWAPYRTTAAWYLWRAVDLQGAAGW
jgi:DNA-3-methyladenine glycosylase II